MVTTASEMINTAATIIELDGNHAIVQVKSDAGCGRCHEEGGCGGNNIGRMFCSTPRRFRILNPDKLSIGTQVDITIADGVVRRSATLAYGLPLAAFLCGAFGGGYLARDVGAIIGSIVCLILAWLGLRHFQSSSNATQPYIVSSKERQDKAGE